jgi:hypothetical protein
VVKIFNWKKGKAPTPYYDQRVDDKWSAPSRFEFHAWMLLSCYNG